MKETRLRSDACDWLKRHYPRRNYHLEPIIFHDIGLTITRFLYRTFKGDQLVHIPRYNNLPIKPDIIAVIKFPSDEYIMGWIVGECKVGVVTVADFRQAIHYASIANAYEAYMFYEGALSRDVLDSIDAGGHLYSGTNRWGEAVKKRLLFIEHKDNRLIKRII